jgi:hypothetical protein
VFHSVVAPNKILKKMDGHPRSLNESVSRKTRDETD